MKEQLHTPEGLRDIYGKECGEKLAIEENILRVLHSYGYRDIQTPTFEYFDVFSKETVTASSRELYRFFDRDGNTLILRPDFTPSVARVCATVLADQSSPVRLCYKGSTFRNHSSYRGELREVTELGAELIGDPSVEADAEMIAMTVNCLNSVGLKDFQVSIGQNDYFKSIIKEAGLDEEGEHTLRHLIINRNLFGVEHFIDEHQMSQIVRTVLLKLPELFGTAEVLKEAYTLSINQESKAAVERVRSLYALLELYGVQDRVTFDFSMLGNYNYYTGVTFQAYTYGTGDAVIKGGRYDNLLGKFGRTMPAIGFAVVADSLMDALDRQNITIPVKETRSVLLYDESRKKAAIRLAGKLRKKGQNIELICRDALPDQEAYALEAAKAGVEYLLFLTEDERVDMLGLQTHEIQSFMLSSMLSEEEIA